MHTSSSPTSPEKPALKSSQEANKLSKRLRHHMGDAINDFAMIQAGDRVMVCLSGGKDSYTLLAILRSLQKSAPIDFSLIAVNLDQKQPGFPADVLPNYLRSIDIDFRIIEEDTYSIVKRLVPEGKTTCSLCSRLRRGILYRVADEVGATKIALGHHRDDLIHTLFLNMFYGGKLKAMPPKLLSDDGRHMVIRPLAYCREKDIVRYAELCDFPIIPCNLWGSQPNLQRQVIKEMVNDWDRRFPGRVESLFRAMQNVVPSHLADPKLFNFGSLKTGDAPLYQGALYEGDLAFDKEVFPETFPDPLASDETTSALNAPAHTEKRTISILDSRRTLPNSAQNPSPCGA